MFSIVQLFIITAAIATVCGDTFKVTNSSQDYFLLSQRELLNDIEIVDVEISAIDARYADRLDVIHLQQQELLAEIQQVNRTLMPLQALSLIRKQCIQQYTSRLITYADAESGLKSCYATADLVAAKLTSTARSNLESARIFVIQDLPTSVASCHLSYPQNETAMQLCYISYVDKARITVNYYVNAAHDRLDESLYESSAASKTAVQCSFKVEKDTLENIGRISEAIDDCEVNLNQEQQSATGNVTNLKMIN